MMQIWQLSGYKTFFFRFRMGRKNDKVKDKKEERKMMSKRMDMG